MTPSGISPEQIESRIAEVKREAAEKRDELDQLLSELEWLESGRRLIGGEKGGTTDEPAVRPTSNGRPPLRQAILRVMQERPRHTWETAEVLSELEAHGWLPGGKNAEHHARSMLGSMHRKGQLRRMKRGRYRLPPEQQQAPDQQQEAAEAE